MGVVKLELIRKANLKFPETEIQPITLCKSDKIIKEFLIDQHYNVGKNQHY